MQVNYNFSDLLGLVPFNEVQKGKKFVLHVTYNILLFIYCAYLS